MIMFAEKVLRRLGGNWTFVIITDREELDDQIAGTFASVGALTRKVRECQAQSSAAAHSALVCLKNRLSSHEDPQFPPVAPRPPSRQPPRAPQGPGLHHQQDQPPL